VLTFSRVAACFEELERTSSRKQLTSLLAELLGQTGADEIAEVSYLLQGRVAPLFEPAVGSPKGGPVPNQQHEQGQHGLQFWHRWALRTPLTHYAGCATRRSSASKRIA
jgi:hypothetical protein